MFGRIVGAAVKNDADTIVRPPPADLHEVTFPPSSNVRWMGRTITLVG
ncbi:hypothetical protein [Arthrobacter sp. H14]|nr:hypothetical protein [Arthrobacter sp. H14]